MTGCALFGSDINEDFKQGSRAYYDYSAPKLRAYIDADGALDADSKRIRKQPIDEYGQLLKTAEKED